MSLRSEKSASKSRVVISYSWTIREYHFSRHSRAGKSPRSAKVCQGFAACRAPRALQITPVAWSRPFRHRSKTARSFRFAGATIVGPAGTGRQLGPGPGTALPSQSPSGRARFVLGGSVRPDPNRFSRVRGGTPQGSIEIRITRNASALVPS